MGLETLVAAAAGYLCGSIPFGLILTRWAGLGDIRGIGSGNIGATNVLRTGNRKIAALTLFLDGLKGAVAVLVMTAAFDRNAGIIAGLAAFVGYVFPVWLGFKGGKGVATAIGVLLAWHWPLGLLVIAVWLAMAFAFRISSLAALTASLTAPLGAWLLGASELVVPAALIAAAIWFNHRANIVRLSRREEPKIKLSKQA